VNSSTYKALSSVFVFLLIFGFIGDVAAEGWDLVDPTVGKLSKLKISGKTRQYFEISPTDTTVIEVTGPTTLKILTRAVLSKKKRDVLYGLIVYRDFKIRNFVGRGSSLDKSASYPKKSKRRISESRSIEFEVPSGTHVYQIIRPKGSKNTVYARFLVPEANKKDINYIAFLPRIFTEEVMLEIREQEYIYYRSSTGKPIEIDVIGPTRIRGLARLEFDHSIRGDQPYRVQISENGKIITTIPITAKISGTATYRDPGDKVPARGENFYIDVPAGSHKIEVSTPDPGVSVLFRFYIPQKDLGNSTTPKSSSHAGRFGFDNKS
jgi:hypothetical protein